MSRYINVGRQLANTRGAAADKTFPKDVPLYIQPFGRPLRTLAQFSDDALARLLSDVRQAENLPIVKPSAPNSGREKVLISDVKQGDQVFRFGDRTPSTVLYAHSCRWFASLLVCCEDEPPFLIQRHKGAYIYRVTK